MDPKKVRGAIAPTTTRKSQGQCWSDDCTVDKVREFYVSPEITDVLTLASTTVHELCHAVLPFGIGHNAPFANLARAMLLTEGTPTAAHGGKEFKKVWKPILADIGPLPGALGFNRGKGRKVAGTRMIKCECGDCGAVWRMASKWISDDLTCPVCQDDSVSIG